MDKLIEQLIEAEKAATPGPWIADGNRHVMHKTPFGPVVVVKSHKAHEDVSDVDLIVLLRNNAQSLISTIKQLQQENAKYWNTIGVGYSESEGHRRRAEALQQENARLQAIREELDMLNYNQAHALLEWKREIDEQASTIKQLQQQLQEYHSAHHNIIAYVEVKQALKQDNVQQAERINELEQHATLISSAGVMQERLLMEKEKQIAQLQRALEEILMESSCDGAGKTLSRINQMAAVALGLTGGDVDAVR